MSTSIRYMDQTLGEGMKKGLPAAVISLMAQELSSLPVAGMDISFAQLTEYEHALAGFRQLLRVRVSSSVQEIAAVYSRGVASVTFIYEHSSGRTITAELENALNKALQLGMKASLAITNASVLSVEEVTTIIQQIRGAGLDSLIYCDSSSRFDPFMAFAAISEIKKRISCSLEFHGANQFGLATANALSAIQAGAQRIGTAVAGVGTPGCAAWEEVLLSNRFLLESPVELNDGLSKRCAVILAAMEEELAVDKAVIGDNIFAHESGLHIFGIQKDPRIYEPFPPEAVGLERYLIVGRHSGTTSLQIVLQEQGIQVHSTVLQRMLKQVRQAVLTRKRPLRSAEVLELCLSGQAV